jgi:hypothetical protein
MVVSDDFRPFVYWGLNNFLMDIVSGVYFLRLVNIPFDDRVDFFLDYGMNTFDDDWFM